MQSDNPAAKGATPLAIKDPSPAKEKGLQVPKLIRKDKAMPIKGSGK
jgi:hypothetical protein